MTKRILTNYTALFSIIVVLALAGVMTVHASEVTGTLSSDTSSNTQTSGNLEGTVNGGSSSSGGSSSRGNRSSSNAPEGAVLGASTSNIPNFPNAGLSPEDDLQHMTIWSKIVTFFRNIVSD